MTPDEALPIRPDEAQAMPGRVPNLARLRRERLERLRRELAQRDYAAALLYDPINIRFASDTRNMAVWTLHNAVRYLFVPTQGPCVLFDFHNCAHISDGIETVDEVRLARAWYYFASGPRVAEQAKAWAAEIADLVHAQGGGNRRLAVDHLDPLGYQALREIGDAQEVCESARRIKSADEILAMRSAIAVAETGMARMREALVPGMTENALWSILHQTNIEQGGEWIETRLLASGPRSNPWFQECGERVIEKGDLVSFDTDLIGPYGYCADISRCFRCGGGRGDETQRRLYAMAVEQIETNLALINPGTSLVELSEKSYRLPERFAPNRYSVVLHGVGLCDEYPSCVYQEDMEACGYDGLLEPGMTVCVESYIGEVGGREGVKLEQQVLITETGSELLSHFPLEQDLLLREI
jgi:Xaa-Pro dipeptidase